MTETLNGMTPEEFDAEAVRRYERDKNAEWERMEDEEWDIAHGLYNAGTAYLDWRAVHECKEYPDHTGIKCAVCGKEI